MRGGATSFTKRTRLNDKMARIASFLFFIAVASVSSALTVTEKRATGGYVQNPSGQASFTHYSGCNQPGTHFHSPSHVVQNELTKRTIYTPTACGIAGSGFTAAISQLAFGSAPGLGPGDACGRCFAVTANQDPFSPSFPGPFKTIVVKVTDLCPKQGNEEWCGQSQSSSDNQHGQPVQ